jgi:hypothetical protein
MGFFAATVHSWVEADWMGFSGVKIGNKVFCRASSRLRNIEKILCKVHLFIEHLLLPKEALDNVPRDA